MRVSIDHEVCISCGLCPEIAPDTFFTGEDGMSYVYDDENPVNVNTPLRRGIEQTASFLATQVDLISEAVDSCPVECIWVFMDEDVDANGNAITAQV